MTRKVMGFLSMRLLRKNCVMPAPPSRLKVRAPQPSSA